MDRYLLANQPAACRGVPQGTPKCFPAWLPAQAQIVDISLFDQEFTGKFT